MRKNIDKKVTTYLLLPTYSNILIMYSQTFKYTNTHIENEGRNLEFQKWRGAPKNMGCLNASWNYVPLPHPDL